MDCLVTGGAGFIGSHLAHRLVRDGWTVRVADNFSTGSPRNLEPFAENVTVIEGDLADAAVCCRACKGVEVVFHQAALPSVPRSIDDPLESHRSNALATLNLLSAARDAGARRFIFAASSSAYGDTPVLPKVETICPQPMSPYAVQKLAGEHYCRAFWECYGLQTISLRYFNVFGPRQDPTSAYAAAIPAFVSAILRDEPPTVYGDGEQTRDFTYIDNVVEANLLAAGAAQTRGEVVNIACGERVTVNAIIAAIGKLLEKRVTARFVAARAGDVRHSWADIERAASLLGYAPGVRFEEGLKRAIDWYAKHL